ncbi:zinc ribbon domain-containing protein [bacterium]|nr:zinc ribbon domain-containing protein [bacterium]
MPTYEYECKSCGHQFERFQKITAKPVRKCPKCGRPVRKLISTGGGLIFKGSGFYITDYARKGRKSEGEKKASEGEKKTSDPAVKPASEKKDKTSEKKTS